MFLKKKKKKPIAGARKRQALIVLSSAVVLFCAVYNFVPAGGRVKTVPEGGGPMGLAAGSAVLMDAGSGRVLFEKNADDRMYPASTTKILTALLAIELGRLDDKVTIGNEIYLAGLDSSKAGLSVGQTMTMKELILGLLLPSGNDAAQSIAVHVARTRPGNRSLSAREAIAVFVGLMNERARQCGAVGSHFVNPDGYHHPDHYSTANDMALIAREAMKHRSFREAVGKEAFVPRALAGKARNGPVKVKKRRSIGGPVRKAGKERGGGGPPGPIMWENTNKLLDVQSPFYFPSATGIKTGHTEKAGYCLVASASQNDRDVISVVMGSTESGVWTDSARLLATGLKLAGARPSSGRGKTAASRN